MNESTPDATPVAQDSSAMVVAMAQEEASLWQTRAAYLQTQAQRAEAARAALEERALALESQVCALEAYVARMETQADQAQALAAHVATRSDDTAAVAPPRPHILDVVDALPHSAEPANHYLQRPLSQIRYLVIHRTDTAPETTPEEIAQFQVTDPRHQWPGIGFHFIVAVDGLIYQTNRLDTTCYHVALHNTAALGIALAGRTTDSPTNAQMTGTASLLAWLLSELRLTAESVIGHCELPNQATNCPGTGWLAPAGWKETLLEQTRQHGQKPRRSIYHYVLFAQSETDWAEADWRAATLYIGRFRPLAGFSVQEAALAENITIVGGPSGVSREVEEKLRSAGCRVQRIAGKNTAQTRTLLDAMAKEGRRFAPTPIAAPGQAE
jgi:hypothetical protein